jgi:hypothetical protein
MEKSLTVIIMTMIPQHREAPLDMTMNQIGFQLETRTDERPP